MAWTNSHLAWLEATNENFRTDCGKDVPVFNFNYNLMDEKILSDWAKHFRWHYCSDSDLKIFKPTGMTSREYLIQLKFPDPSKPPGPSIRAGDFAEILVADYLQYMNNYYVPRTRYDRKGSPNESSKGSDVLGFLLRGTKKSADDELLIYEVKAQLSKGGPNNKLQIAIDHSIKDDFRVGISLNAIRQRLGDKNAFDEVEMIDRFQNPTDTPYKLKFGAAAVLSNTRYCAKKLSASSSLVHPKATDLELLVIRGEDLMALTYSLYERASYAI